MGKLSEINKCRAYFYSKLNSTYVRLANQILKVKAKSHNKLSINSLILWELLFDLRSLQLVVYRAIACQIAH